MSTPGTATETSADPRPASGVDANAVLALIAVAQFMVVLDATVVNVALPTIKVDVGFSEQSLSWVLNAYTLIFGGFLLLGGRLADRLGRRRLFVAGIALFSGASLICGLAQSEGMLLVARGVQGLGGALASRIVPESRSESARGGYDAQGAVAITLGMMALVFTLIKANSWGWTSGR